MNHKDALMMLGRILDGRSVKIWQDTLGRWNGQISAPAFHSFEFDTLVQLMERISKVDYEAASAELEEADG